MGMSIRDFSIPNLPEPKKTKPQLIAMIDH
jgi:hypothetical protein